MTLPVYGLWVLGAAVCFFIMLLLGTKGMKAGTAQVYCVMALPVCLIASRLVFCLVCAGYFFSNIAQPLKMLHFFDGGYSMTGLILGLMLSAALTAKIMKVPFGRLMDSVALASPLSLVLLRMGEGHTTLGTGREVISTALQNSPFFTLPDARHAVFRYEAVYGLLLFIVMVLVVRKPWRGGDKALLLGTLYGAAQIVFESMRDDFHMVWGFVRAQQVFAIFLPVAAIVIFSVRLAQKKGSCKGLIPYWVITAFCIALGIIKEFDIDTSKNLFIDYGLMAFGVGLLAAVATALLIKSNKEKA